MKRELILFLGLISTACGEVGFHEDEPTFTACADPAAPDCGVTVPGQPFTQKYLIQSGGKRTADILFIVDTSGSMGYEQEHIRQRFHAFIESLSDIDWRVAITTARFGDDLLAFHGAPDHLRILHSGLPQASQYFSNTIRRPKSCGLIPGVDDCDEHERAIAQANLMIRRQSEHGFFRRGADVNIIIVSDEDERSTGRNLEAVDLPETLVANARALKARSFTVHAIINRPGDADCLRGQGERYGHVYQRVAQLTGGIVGDVCASDYTRQLRLIANAIHASVRALDLPCEVQDIPLVACVPVLDASYEFSIRGKKLLFNRPLPEGAQIVVDGICRPSS